MSFATFGDFLAMGHHGLYVWSAYGICLAVLALNVAAPLLARRRYLQEEARRLRQRRTWLQLNIDLGLTAVRGRRIFQWLRTLCRACAHRPYQ